MKKIFILLFLVCCLYQVSAQKETAIWYFGNNAGLDFNSGNPMALNDGALATIEGCATISDRNGALLFYTDGIRVWNRNHSQMPDGFGLRGDKSSTQSAIIVPRPGSSTVFYVFTVDNRGGSGGLMYSEVDMALDGGLGNITAVKNVQLATPVSEKITAVEHANGSDIWVLSHGHNNNTFMAYLVTPGGVSPVSVNTDIGINLGLSSSNLRTLGYVKASPDGTKVASCFYENTFELYDFDTTTGILSNVRVLCSDISKTYYGVEFSQNSSMLYMSDFDGGLYQYDTNALDIAASETLIFQTGGNSIGGLQLGIDGKIYMAYFNADYLSVIEQPENSGLACGFVQQGVDLNGKISQLGLPPFIQSFFNISFTAENLCSGSPTDFELTTSEPVVSILWDFGDGTTSMVESPDHTYATGGTYTVNATVTTASGIKTEAEQVTIYTTPVANVLTDIEQCSLTATIEFDLSTMDTEILGTQSATEFQTAYFPSLTDAENDINPLSLLYTNTLPSETLYARIQNIQNPDCFDTAQFNIAVKLAPVLNMAIDWTVCDVDTDGMHSFDLSQKNSEIYNGQDGSIFSVGYFESQSDADNNTNSIGPNYTNSTSLQPIFYRIYNSVYPECYETGSFNLEVVTAVTANTPTDIAVCDENGTGVQVLDLSTKDLEVLNGQNPNSFSVTYFVNRSDAENNQNPLSKTSYSNTNPRETIFARSENIGKPNCFAITQFDIIVNALPQILLEETYVICPDSPELTIDGGNFESWSWNNGNGTEIETDRYINITDLGNYTLTVTQTSNGVSCEKTVPVEVVSSGAPEDFTTEIGNPSDNVTITVNTVGSGEFEYSSDGENFQDSNRLEVFPGEYTLYVRDKFLCRTINKEVIALGYQKFFTPNGDGANDSWNIIGADFYPESQLYIYDRYGKLLQQVSPMTAGWDGSYKGQPLPSSDYWFRYIFDGGKVFTGHFSIKR